MSILDVDQVAEFLKIDQANTRARLQGVLDAAERAIARKLDLRRLDAYSVTERVTGGRSVLVLSTGPVVGVDSVAAVDGAAVTIAPEDVTGQLITGTWTAARYAVTYRVGFVVDTDPEALDGGLPPDLALAVREMTRILWRPQRGAGVRPGSAPSEAGGSQGVVDKLLSDFLPTGDFA